MRKRLRVSNESHQDYISNLPHCVLSDILSRLCTKDALRTSVLSRDWRNTWTSIDDIDMTDIDEYFCGTDGIANFNCAVTRLLLGKQNSIRSFLLHCSREGHRPFDFETWTSQVLKRNVQILQIYASKISGLNSPWCFSGWTSLEVFTLDMSCTLKVPANNCFPNLKSLALKKGEHGNLKIMTAKAPNTGGVTLVFPVLEDLQLTDCEWLDVDYVEIQAPELIKFRTRYKREFKTCSIKICGPKLAMFEMCGRVPAKDFVLEAPTVTYVTFTSLSRTAGLQAHNIWKKFPNLKSLRISARPLRGLLRSELECILPTFARLKELEVSFRCGIKYVVDSLQMLPPIESLIINVSTLDDYEFGDASPPKIITQLKKVELLNFNGSEGQLEFVKYLLENAMNLQVMTVNLKNISKSKEITTPDELIDILEGIGEFVLAKLKPEDSRCEIVVVEQIDQRLKWNGPWKK